MAIKKVELDGSSVPNKDPFAIGEIGTATGIEQVTENDFVKAVDKEAFMNQLLTIILAPSSNKEDLPVVTPNVNGINQPIVRGRQTKVKRKYVEALIRCTNTRYEQRVADPSQPDKIKMVEYTVPQYPLTVISDPHPNGFAWLESITASL